MKNKFNYFVVSIIFSFSFFVMTSCEKDNDYSASDIVGVWSLIAEEGYHIDYEDDQWNSTWDDTFDVGENVYEFYEDGTMWIEDEREGEGYENHWKIKGNKLILGEEGNTSQSTILSLTSTKLVLEFKYKNKEYSIYQKITMQKLE